MSEGRGTPTAIRLLILTGSRDQAEIVEASLRNGGLAVHCTRISNMGALEETLQSQHDDLLLCCAFDPAIDPHRTLETVAEQQRDLPVLLLSAADTDPVGLLQAMREGARDLIDKGDLEHLQLVVTREIGDLQRRRELAALRQRLQESEQRCRDLIEGSREAIAFFQDGMHVHVNPAYLQLFGFQSRAEVEDLPLLDIVGKSHHKALRAALKELEADPGRRSVTLDATCRCQDGATTTLTLRISKADMEGEPGLQLIVRNNGLSPQALEQKLPQLSRTDADTQLPSRPFFLSQIALWLGAPAENADVRALLYLAIDDFSKLHSKLGIQRSDQLVRDIADRIRATLGPLELLSRFSDSTFALLCRRPTPEALLGLGESLTAVVAAMPSPDREQVPEVTLSIGIAYLGDSHASAQELLNQACNACETAQERGGNQVRSPALPQSGMGTKDARILEMLDRALHHDRFRLVYQPIVSLQGDSRENYAVMVRMLDEHDEELLPEVFIGPAERHGKMAEIDRWVIRHAIAALSALRQQGHKINFFIILSDAAILDKNLLLWVCDCLREHDARGGWLTFQIREQHARDSLPAVLKLIDGLKKIKCQIALDHFGLLPGPDDLLDQLEVDYVKLAPSLVQEINSSQQKQDELSHLNEMIVRHKVRTIATAVEDANSLAVLWTVGIAYIQGHFLQEPSPIIEHGTQQSV